jgi:hypothetical protein
MTRLARRYGLDDAIRRFEGAVFGTCAGMILVERERLGLIDLVVRRNAFGRQVASFEAALAIAERSALLRATAPHSGPGILSEAGLDDGEVVREFVRSAECAHVGKQFIHDAPPSRALRCQVFDTRVQTPDNSPVAENLENPVAEYQQARLGRNWARFRREIHGLQNRPGQYRNQ